MVFRIIGSWNYSGWRLSRISVPQRNARRFELYHGALWGAEDRCGDKNRGSYFQTRLHTERDNVARISCTWEINITSFSEHECYSWSYQLLYVAEKMAYLSESRLGTAHVEVEKGQYQGISVCITLWRPCTFIVGKVLFNCVVLGNIQNVGSATRIRSSDQQWGVFHEWWSLQWQTRYSCRRRKSLLVV